MFSIIFNIKEDKLRKTCEHLNDPLHILIEADLPANIVDIRLRQAQEINEELLKPMVFTSCPIFASDGDTTIVCDDACVNLACQDST